MAGTDDVLKVPVEPKHFLVGFQAIFKHILTGFLYFSGVVVWPTCAVHHGQSRLSCHRLTDGVYHSFSLDLKEAKRTRKGEHRLLIKHDQEFGNHCVILCY